MGVHLLEERDAYIRIVEVMKFFKVYLYNNDAIHLQSIEFSSTGSEIGVHFLTCDATEQMDVQCTGTWFTMQDKQTTTYLDLHPVTYHCPYHVSLSALRDGDYQGQREDPEMTCTVSQKYRHGLSCLLYSCAHLTNVLNKQPG